ncbi:FAD-binding oxidoreductase [Aspergillus lucknowensis]|uniref:FAD-binding PCMH-type domain-containing protein n=1 Tax=Aspergillus lucknowensis TaxID=176173 RepID=A0ABR4LY02_9EURO
MPFLGYNLTLELRRELEGTRAEIACRGTDNYGESIKSWSDTCQKEAGAVVYVTTTEEVSIVIAFARKHHIEFVVKGGGHSTGGESASHGGIVISLRKMRKVLADPASETVCVQGGCTWDEVNKATAPYNLAVVGATASQTGVGGSTLGGGYGWLTGRHGLIIDSLVGVRVVLADGSVFEASEDAHQDLFWAIRGAGQAFGVVTEFTFRAHHIPDQVFGGLLYFSVDKLRKVVEFANWFDEQQDENSGFFFGFSVPSLVDEPVITAVLFYNGTKDKAHEFFAPLLSLDSVTNTTDMMSYTELSQVTNIEPIPEGRKCFGGTHIKFPLDETLVKELWNVFSQITEDYPLMGNSVLAFELLPYGKVMSVPVDATACANRGRFYNVGLLLCWREAGHDAVMDQYRQFIISKIEHSQKGDTGEGVAAYANYAGHDFGAKYLFGDNLPRLQELKRLYDPHNVFRKWHNLLSSTDTHPA